MFESTIEELLIELFKVQGFSYVYAPDISCDGEYSEREGYGDVLLRGRLRDAVRRINPGMLVE